MMVFKNIQFKPREVLAFQFLVIFAFPFWLFFNGLIKKYSLKELERPDISWDVKSKFNPSELNLLKKNKPEFVMIGNSMLASRINTSHLNSRISPDEAYLLALPGSGADLWFLLFKNVLIGSGIKPKVVFFFFLERELTTPPFIPPDKYLDQLEVISTPYEPEYQDLMKKSNSTQKGILSHKYRFKKFVKDTVETKASKIEHENSIKSLAFSVSQNNNAQWKVFSERINKIFSYNNFRGYANKYEQLSTEKRPVSFEEQLPFSFLPNIIKLSKKHDLKLVFVRIKSRNTASRNAVDKFEEQYVNSLRKYVESHQHDFHNFEKDKEITIDMYADGSHLALKDKKWYTDRFFRIFEEIFE